jgi:rhodanese-related sulfurtransferase
MMSSVPTIAADELGKKLASSSGFVLLDVREAWELRYARIDDQRLVHVPMSALARDRDKVLPPEIISSREVEVVVMCHHGIRSADVTRWMLSQGWTNVSSLQGGIAAYYNDVDKSVGWY